MNRRSLAALALVLVSPLQAQSTLRPKDVAAPPEDFLSGRLRLPLPEDVPVRSNHALLELEFVRGRDGRWISDQSLPVERDGSLGITVLASEGNRLDVRARSPWAGSVNLTAQARRGVRSVQRGALASADRYEHHRLESRAGDEWQVRLSAPGNRPRPSGVRLLVTGGGELQLETHVASFDLLSDRPIGFVARLSDEAAYLEEVELVLTSAGQTIERVFLADDGRGADRQALDGVLAIQVEGLRGNVHAHFVARGLDGQGRPFLRTSDHELFVAEPDARLSDRARLLQPDPLRLRVELDAWTAEGLERVQSSFEVWGTARDGSRVPVVWLSRMVPLSGASSWQPLALSLDRRWLELAGAGLPLELRNVRLQDPESHVPYDRRERVSVAASALAPWNDTFALGVTRDMLMGPAVLGQGIGTLDAGNQVVEVQDTLMLSHGYCSGGMPWPLGDFSGNRVVFFDPDANRSHDEFAQLMAQTGEDLSSFGVIGHSQGGNAALHLYTYYTSGLDHARGARRIQSVGTPYQGTPLANLGSFACGNNTDLSPSGATLWLAGIPTWARAEVSYWTTQNSGSACNFLTNLILSSPNDGTTERSRGQLPGANSMGHVTGWCHTTGMSNPAQYLDTSRNSEMDVQAAR